MAEITGYGNMRISYGGVDIDIATKAYKLDKYEQESLKFEFEDQWNIAYLYKKGNRWYREIRVYQIAQTDEEFQELFIKLDKMNGKAITLTPHLDEPTITQLTWLTAFWDRYNEYPVEFIELKLEAVDVEKYQQPTTPQAPIITFTQSSEFQRLTNITSPSGGQIYYETSSAYGWTPPEDPTTNSLLYTSPLNNYPIWVKAVVYKNGMYSPITEYCDPT